MDLIRTLVETVPAQKELRPLSELTLIPNFFSPEECKVFIKLSEVVELEQLTTRKRLQFDSQELADWWWQRLQPKFKYSEQVDKWGNLWTAFGLNTHFRLGRYDEKDEFSKHEDGYYQPQYNIRSFTTAMVYLNTVPVENGGATYFMEHGFRIQPMEGLGCVFVVDDLLHSGEPLLKGQKYLLRTDVMYRCETMKQPELQQRIFELKTQAGDLEDAGKELESVKVWDQIFKLECQLERPSCS
jgi:hypothetical protein